MTYNITDDVMCALKRFKRKILDLAHGKNLYFLLSGKDNFIQLYSAWSEIGLSK